MNNIVRTKIYGVIITVILVIGSVFHYHKNQNQKIILAQPDMYQSVQRQEFSLPDIKLPPNDVPPLIQTMPSKVPILMYHYIREYVDPSDPIGVNLSVAPKTFEEQIAWLKENGYGTVSPDIFSNPQELSFKPIVLTFDDGYQDAYDVALPILKKYGMSGMFYVIVNKIGTPGYLTWDEIIHMQAEGMSFGSHTLSHPDLRHLSTMNLDKELKESKQILEQKLGGKITDFCYPSGKYTDEVVKDVSTSGYKTAVTTASGISTLKSNPYLLSRIRMTQNTNISHLLPQ